MTPIKNGRECDMRHLGWGGVLVGIFLTVQGGFFAFLYAGQAEQESRLRNVEVMAATRMAQITAIQESLVRIENKQDALDKKLDRRTP